MQFPYMNLERTIIRAVAGLRWGAVINPPCNLKAAAAYHREKGMIGISAEHSDYTIYSSPFRNWQARAWHDWAHIQYGLEFDAEGEAKVCAILLQEAKEFGADGNTLAAIFADNEGQQIYSRFHDGAFPTDQRAFVLAFMQLPSIAAFSEY